MQIGEVARRTGFSTDTLRYYEKLGLITLDKKNRGENNYRSYDQAVVERLLLIKQTKSLGFTLKEIKQLLDLEEINLLACASVEEIIQAKLRGIEEKIRALQQIQSKLMHVSQICEGDCIAAMNQVG